MKPESTPEIVALETRVKRLDKLRRELEETLSKARSTEEKAQLTDELQRVEREWRDAELDLERTASLEGGE